LRLARKRSEIEVRVQVDGFMQKALIMRPSALRRR
jgi:hypothetical protein